MFRMLRPMPLSTTIGTLALLVSTAMPEEPLAPSTPPPDVEVSEIAPPPMASPASVHPARRDRPPVEHVESRRRNRLTFGPLPLVLGLIPIEYERAVTDRLSVVGGVVPIPWSGILSLVGIYMKGVRGNIGGRFFPFAASAPAGVWVGGELIGEVAHVEAYIEAKSEDYRWGFGALVTGGYTAILASGFTMSAGVGGGVRRAWRHDVVTTSGELSPRPLGVTLPEFAVHANIGWAY
jgi:hypothetical protein